MASLLVSAALALTACDGGSSGTQAGVANAQAQADAQPQAQANASNVAEVGSSLPLPCDSASAAGTTCSAAHSVTRLLTKYYTGPLFQLVRASDNSTRDIYPYTSATLPHNSNHDLIGTTNLNSVNSFCKNTTCSVSTIYDQIDLVASLKGGTYGNVPAKLTLNQDGSESLTLPTGGAGSQSPTTVPVLNGFATITLPGTSGSLKVQVSQPPTALTAQAPTEQLTVGNDLPALSGSPAQLTMVTVNGNQYPSLTTLAGQAYRNRFGTVNQSIGDTDIAEYMVAGAHYDQSSTCCGTYGNMENSANPSTYAHGEVEGEMFALAFSDGAAAVFGYCDGDSAQSPTTKDPVCNGNDVNWPGVDAEAGVYLYGPQQPYSEKFVTVLAKYSPVTASNLFAVKGGSASQGVLTAVYDGVPPEAYIFSSDAGHAFNGQWQGGLSLGEGGDGSAAPIQFYEGAVLTKATSDATDNSIQASIASFYGPPANPNNTSCYAGNLVNSPLSLSTPDAWTQSNGGTATPAMDIFGTQKAAMVTTTNGSSVSNIHEVIRVQGGQTYSFTDYVAATSNATVFPGGSVQTDDPAGTEFGWVLNTNTGAIVRGTWGAGQANSLSAQKVGGKWWKITMNYTAPAGSHNASIFIDPPTSSAAGVRSQQAAYLSATHYCPAMQISSTASGS